MPEIERAMALLTAFLKPYAAQLTSIWLPIQVGLIALAAVIAFGAATLIRRRVDLVSLTMGLPPYVRLVLRALWDHLGTILFIIVASLMRLEMQVLTAPGRSYLLGVAVKLATAWIVIVVATSMIRNKLVNRMVAVAAWTIAALSILGLLDRTQAALDSIAITIGGHRLTPLLVIKASALLLLALWAAGAIGNFLDRRLHSLADLTPSVQELLTKLARLALIILAIVLVLGSLGIDLSALALFSGAIGVGIGFGLQRIVSNLVSGIILLSDKSIKPGDIITVGDNFGWVKSMGARCTLVDTRDGREYLIPNEDFITQRVINWSYSNEQVRLEVKFGVAYGSDPHVVRRLALEAATAVPRVLASPEPVCHLIEFGDSALNFTLRFWISDPIDGVTNVRGTVMLALWDSFKREGIEIPYPVRDMQITRPVRVLLGGEQQSPG
jgi:small-conductance mechanosensitive channel